MPNRLLLTLSLGILSIASGCGNPDHEAIVRIETSLKNIEARIAKHDEDEAKAKAWEKKMSEIRHEQRERDKTDPNAKF